VLIGNGDGTFQPLVTYPVAKGPVGAFINQIDDNDSIDLVCVCETDSKITPVRSPRPRRIKSTPRTRNSTAPNIWLNALNGS